MARPAVPIVVTVTEHCRRVGRGSIRVAAFAAGVGSTTPLCGASEIVQPYDGSAALAAERNTAVSIATTADDFFVPNKDILRQIEATFLVDPDFPIVDWEYLIYADAGGVPGVEIARHVGGTAEDTG